MVSRYARKMWKITPCFHRIYDVSRPPMCDLEAHFLCMLAVPLQEYGSQNMPVRRSKQEASCGERIESQHGTRRRILLLVVFHLRWDFQVEAQGVVLAVSQEEVLAVIQEVCLQASAVGLPQDVAAA